MLVDVEKTKEGTDTQWLAESGIVDLFIMLGPSPKDVRLFLAHSGSACVLRLVSHSLTERRFSGLIK